MKNVNNLKKSIVALAVFCSVVTATTGHLLGGNAKAQSMSPLGGGQNHADDHGGDFNVANHVA